MYTTIQSFKQSYFDLTSSKSEKALLFLEPVGPDISILIFQSFFSTLERSVSAFYIYESTISQSS